MNRPNPDRRPGELLLVDRDAGAELRERELRAELAQARREKERAEAALRESERKYQELVEQAADRAVQESKLEKLSRLRAVVSEINAAIVRAPNRQALYHEACRIAVELGRFGIAWFGSFDAARMELTPVASAGIEGDSILCSTQLVFSTDHSARESALALDRKSVV